MNPYPKGDVALRRDVRRVARRATRPTTLDDGEGVLRRLLRRLATAELAVVGDFDDAAAASRPPSSSAPGRARPASRALPQPYKDVASANKALETPDKANAFFIAGHEPQRCGDDDPDYPALVLGNYMLGGGFLNSRLAVRIRAEGRALLRRRVAVPGEPARQGRHVHGVRDLRAAERGQARGRVQGGDRPRAQGRLHRRGDRRGQVRLAAVAPGRRARRIAPLARTLATDLYIERTLAWDAALEKKVEALTGEQVLAAMRKYIDPAKMTIVKAGDFAKGGAAAAPAGKP